MTKLRAAIYFLFTTASGFSPKKGYMSTEKPSIHLNRLFASDEKGIESPQGNDWRSFDPKDIGSGGTYGLGISTIVPRPIAVITSLSDKGVLNCAPFS